MKINLKKVLASSFTLALVGCNAVGPFTQPKPQALSPVKQARQNTPQTEAVTKPTVSTLAKPVFEYRGRGEVKGQTETIQINLALPELSVLFASYADLKFIQVEVSGKNAAGEEKTWMQTGDAFLAVTDRNVNATVEGIAIADGELRIVKVKGFDADKNPLPAFDTMGYYFSEAGKLNIDLNIGRENALLAAVLEAVKDETVDNLDPEVENPTVLSLLKDDLGDMQTAIAEATNYNAQTQAFERDPSTFNVTEIKDSILNEIDPETGLFAEPADLEGFKTALTNGTFQIETQDSGNIRIVFMQEGFNGEGERRLGEDLVLMVNDPSSKPLQLSMGAESNTDYEIANIAPGEWTLTLSNSTGTVLETRTVSVDGDGASIADSSTLDVSGRVKELRRVTVEMATAMQSKMLKWGEKVHLTFASAPDVTVDIECNDRFAHSAWIPVGETTAYVRNTTGKILGETQITANVDGTFTQAQNPMMLTDVTLSETAFVNTDNSMADMYPKVATDANGNYVVVWYKAAQVANFFNDGDSTNTNGGIYARTYNADGTPRGEAFRVVSEETMFANGDDGDGFFLLEELSKGALYDVAMDETGRFIVTWTQTDLGFDGENTNVYANGYDLSGASLYNVPFRVHDEALENQSAPSIDMRPNGDYVIVWEDDYDHDNIELDGDSIQRQIRGRLLDIDRQIVNADEFYVTDPTLRTSNGTPDIDGEATFNVYPRVSMNTNGAFVVTWNQDEDDDGPDDHRSNLMAKMFKADGSDYFEDGDSMVQVTRLEEEVPTLFNVQGDGFGFGDGFGLGDGDVFNASALYDVSMGTDAANFVVTWINEGEDEISGQNVGNKRAPSVYARHYFEVDNDGDSTLSNSDTIAVSYDPVAEQNVNLGDGQAFAFAMAPSVDMNTSGDFVVSWNNVNNPSASDINNSRTGGIEFDRRFARDYQALQRTNTALHSRLFTRFDNDRFGEGAINKVNLCAMPPIPFGSIFGENGNRNGLFDGPGRLFLLFSVSTPEVQFKTAGSNTPLSVWHYYNFFNLFANGGDRDGGNNRGLGDDKPIYDINARTTVQEVPAPLLEFGNDRDRDPI